MRQILMLIIAKKTRKMADVVDVAEDTQQGISMNTDFIIEDCMVQVSELEPELEALVLESIHTCD